jgi:protease I
MMARILILLPQNDFDPTEVAIPWSCWTKAGIDVAFATENGMMASCDIVTLTGNGLPGYARSLAARPEVRQYYAAMSSSSAFRKPMSWASVNISAFSVVHFPGGHAPGMKTYLESGEVQRIARRAFDADIAVSAICHGVVALARTRRADGNSVLFGRKTTALTQRMERISIALTRQKLGFHYRTYPQTVESEVRAALASARDFKSGPLIPRFATERHPDRGFVVEDGKFLSARWPGDAWTLATRIRDLLLHSG